ncbi:MAG: orange carotenoid protein N-terminal domain-containing protein [Cyanobacteria bacterium P01_D01_bin.156]
MTLATDKAVYSNIFSAVPDAVVSIQRLPVDEQLGLLWCLYENMGGLVTPVSPGATDRIKLAGTLIYQVANLSHEEQLQFMRDLVTGANNPMTRDYGCLTSNNKLAFWYQLAEWMRSGDVIPVPQDYKLSAPANAVLNKLIALGFNQQIAVLRLIVGKMGINPLTA